MNKSVLVAVVAALLAVSSAAILGVLTGLPAILAGVSPGGTGLPDVVANAGARTVESLGGATVDTVNLTPPTDDEVSQTLTDLKQFLYGLGYLPNLVTAEAILNTATTLRDGITTLLKNPTTQNMLTFLFNGVTLGDGKFQNNLGAMGLPTYTLCPLGLQYKLTSCVICHQDCQVSHNALGGKCGKSPIGAGGDTCLCAYTKEDAEARNIQTSSEATCEAYNPIVALEEIMIGAAFRARFAVQCLVNGKDASGADTYDNTGCNADCRLNHGSPGGECLMQYPLVHNAVTSDYKKSAYCICKNADGSLGSGTPEGPAGPPSA